MNIDDLQLLNAPALPPPTIAPSHTVAGLTGLVGFDVDTTGTTLVARTDAGSTIRTFSAQSMSSAGSIVTTCNRVDGVMASRSHVAYIDCTGTDPSHFRIRSSALGTPSFPSGCDFCNGDFALSDFTGGGTMLEIRDLIRFPISREFFAEGGIFGTEGVAPAGWAFTTTDALLGAAIHNNIDNAADEQRTATRAYGFGANADQICVARPTPTSESLYIIAVDDGLTTQSFDVTFTAKVRNHLPGDPSSYIDVAMSTARTYSTSVSSSPGVDCALDRVIVITDKAAGDDVVVFQQSTGAIVWSARGLGYAPTALGRQVAISGNAQFVAYMVNTTHAFIAIAGNGTVLGQVVAPSGDFRGIQLDETGGNLWIATSTGVSKYEISGVTGSEGISEDVVPPPTGGGSAGGPVLGAAVTQFGDSFGTDSFHALLMVAGLVILIIGGIIASVHVPTGGGVMAFGGFSFVWGMGLLPDEFVYATIILGVLVAGILFFARRGG